MKRRRVLALLTSTVPLAGCASMVTETPTDTETGTPSPGATESTTRTPTPTPSPTTTADLSPETLLPPAGDGWALERTEEDDWRYIGGVDGKHGFYTSPKDVPFEAVTMEVKADLDATRIARSWKCYPGWQVTLAYQGFAIAAGSGTSQETGTPDVPKMTRTPEPNSVDDARTLLGRSPRLDSVVMSEHEIESC